MRSKHLQRAAAVATCAVSLAAPAHADPTAASQPSAAATHASASSRTSSAAPSAPATAPVRPLVRDVSEWRGLLSTVPKVALYASEFAPLPASATKTAIERSGRTRESIATWTFVDGPFEWKPNAKRSFWIVSGRAGPRVVIAVFEPGAQPKHLASTVLLEPDPALAIGWSASEPNRLLWTTCYGCQGLGGSIDVNADGQVAFVYR